MEINYRRSKLSFKPIPVEKKIEAVSKGSIRAKDTTCG